MLKEKRRCRACGEIKILSEFHHYPSHKKGIRNRCKRCDALYQREYRKRTKQKREKRVMAQLRQENKEVPEIVAGSERDKLMSDIIKAQDNKMLNTPEIREKIERLYTEYGLVSWVREGEVLIGRIEEV